MKEWFAANRHLMSANGVWFAGGEPGTTPAGQFLSSQVRVLIVRLSEYSEVAAGITHTYLYQMAAAIPGCFVDMAFLPPERDEKLMLAGKIPLLTGTNTKMPAAAFDIIAISNSVVQELLNLPAMLHFSGIPLSCAARSKAASPLLILGGSNSCVHSILHGPTRQGADPGLVDAVLMGDGEKSLAAIIETVKNSAYQNRSELLKKLRDTVAGFYDPSAYTQNYAADGSLCSVTAAEGAPMPVKSNKAACRPGSETFTGGPLLYDGAGSSHVVVSAGCPSFCSFCKESWEQKPYRENSATTVIDSARALKANLGLREISLMTFNANTCSDIFLLVEKLGGMFDRVAIKSQRFDAVVNSPELLDLQFEAGKRTYTCAMEGISERLRTLLQKNLDEKTILSGIELLLQRNVRQMKVFLIVTGYEHQNDMDEFRAFLDRLRGRCEAASGRPRLTFSFATLFRAPQTPMQFAPPRENEDALAGLLKKLAAIVTTAGFEARISSGPEDAIVSEYIAFADRRHTPVLVEASVDAGLRYRGEISRRVLDFWRSGLKKLDLKPLCERPRDLQTVFPWDDVDTGVSRQFLWHVWQNLQAGKEIRACIAQPWGNAGCSGCGACSSSDEIAFLTRMGPPADPTSKLRLPAKTVKRQHWLLFSIPEKWAFCSREFIKAAMARRLLLDHPELIDGFIRVELLEPDFFSWGQALASVSFGEDVSFKLKTGVTTDDDIAFIRFVVSGKKAVETAFPVLLEASGAGCPPESSLARDIDAILTKHSLKNQKQRHNGWLNWQIAAGQARKAGIEKISLNETNGDLRLNLIRWPELFMLNRLAFGRSFKVSLNG